jgi:hypothetical protein
MYSSEVGTPGIDEIKPTHTTDNIFVNEETIQAYTDNTLLFYDESCNLIFTLNTDHIAERDAFVIASYLFRGMSGPKFLDIRSIGFSIKPFHDGETPDPLTPGVYRIIGPIHAKFKVEIPAFHTLPGLQGFSSNKESTDTRRQRMILREECLARDRRCVVTHQTDANELGIVHLVPVSFAGQEASCLPHYVRCVLQRCGGIHSLGNTLLMSKFLHQSFSDDQEWAIHIDENGRHWKFNLSVDIGIDSEVQVPDYGKYADRSWRDLWPRPALFRYRMQCAVYKHFRPDSKPQLSRKHVISGETK